MLSKKQLSFLIVLIVCLSCIFSSVVAYSFPIVKNDLKNQNDFKNLNDSILTTGLDFSENNYLKSITITEKYSLTPAFDKNVENYIVNVPFEETRIDIEYELDEPETATVTTENFEAKENLKTGSNLFKINVKSEALHVKTYTIDVVRAKNDNCYLSSLGIYKQNSDTQIVDIGFDRDISTYNVDVPYTVDVIDVRYTLASSDATAKTDGVNTLEVGKVNVYHVVVTAENGSTKIYTLNIRRTNQDTSSSNNLLRDLEVEGFLLAPRFNKNQFNYDVDVSYNTEVVSIKAISDDVNAIVNMYVNAGVNINPEAIKLGIGTTIVKINVIAPNSSNKVYTLNIFRPEKNYDKSANNYLKSLSVKAGEEELNLSPQFNKEIFEYTTWVNYRTESVSLALKKEDRKATIYIEYENEIIESGKAINLEEGTNVINIEVVAENNKAKIYKVKVIKEKARAPHTNNNLSSMIINGHNLSPAFTPSNSNYTVNITDKEKQLDLRVQCEDQYATYEIVGNENFQIGENIVLVNVKAEDESIKTYTIKVIRPEGEKNNYLKSLTVEEYRLDPLFNKDVLEYRVKVPFTTRNVHVVAIPEDPLAKCRISDEGLNLDGSKENVITVTVIAQNNDVREYKLTIVLSKDYNPNPDQDKNKGSGVHNSSVIPGGSTLGIPNWLLGVIIVVIIIVLSVFGTLIGGLIAQKRKYKITPYVDKKQKAKKEKASKSENNKKEQEENNDEEVAEDAESSDDNKDDEEDK